MLSSGAFAIMPEGDYSTGQGWVAPYAPPMVASGPNWTEAPVLAPAPRTGGYAAIPAQVPLNAYQPKTVAGTPVQPKPPNGAAMPCNCNGNANSLQAIPWWGWALIAIGVVAIFRRVT